MNIREITMLCVVMVVATATTTAPATVTAATLRAPMLAQATPALAAPKAIQATAPKTSRVDAVETRIKDLHARLKITPAQEDLWNSATQVMRENAKAMDELRKVRSEKTQTMTAVEDFTSYGEITQVHADGIKKFVPVFSALYDSMSDAQKKNADTIFRRGPGQKASR